MFPFFIKVNQYLFYNFAASNQPYITMLNGHGDDSYRYGRKITLNFSSNVYHHTSLAPLFRHLENSWEQVRSYPEPSPHAVESQLARAMGISAELVCLTSGATEAIYLIAQTFSGRRSCILSPTFSEYADACRLHGHQVRSIYTTDHLPEDADIVWICNPNNPTGSVLPHDEMKRLAAQHPDVLFVIDQSYEDFTPRMLFSPHEAAARSNVILLHSLTKRFGIPGLRVGYLTARQEWTARIRQNKMPWSVNTLALEAALFLTEHEKDFRIDLQSLLEERARVAGQLEALRIAEVWPGETHFLLARLRMGKASALKDYLAETHGMLIRDAGNFEGLDERYFRIAVQSPEEDDRLLAAIGEWMFSI